MAPLYVVLRNLVFNVINGAKDVNMASRNTLPYLPIPITIFPKKDAKKKPKTPKTE